MLQTLLETMKDIFYCCAVWFGMVVAFLIFVHCISGKPYYRVWWIPKGSTHSQLMAARVSHEFEAIVAIVRISKSDDVVENCPHDVKCSVSGAIPASVVR